MNDSGDWQSICRLLVTAAMPLLVDTTGNHSARSLARSVARSVGSARPVFRITRGGRSWLADAAAVIIGNKTRQQFTSKFARRRLRRSRAAISRETTQPARPRRRAAGLKEEKALWQAGAAGRRRGRRTIDATAICIVLATDWNDVYTAAPRRRRRGRGVGDVGASSCTTVIVVAAVNIIDVLQQRRHRSAAAAFVAIGGGDRNWTRPLQPDVAVVRRTVSISFNEQ